MTEKLLYIANARMPTEKAHGIQIANMCEAFADKGEEVELILPRRFNSVKSDIFSYYGVKNNFSVKKLFCFDFITHLSFLGKFAYFTELDSFYRSVFWHIFFRHRKENFILYTRDLWSAVRFFKKWKVVYEAHSLPKKTGWIFRYLIKKINKFVVISKGLKDDFIKFGVSEDDILVAPDAVKINEFNISESQSERRKELNLPLDRQIIMYTGHLYDWKGADTLLDAAQICPDKLFVFVGGTDKDVKRFEKKISEKAIQNALFVGYTQHKNIPKYLKAADALVLPNSAKEAISARHTSPLKLFEYMASRRPIIASDLPSVREILDESSATFFSSDNARSLADSICFVFANSEESARKASRAFDAVKEFTWEKRAEKILNYVRNNRL